MLERSRYRRRVAHDRTTNPAARPPGEADRAEFPNALQRQVDFYRSVVSRVPSLRPHATSAISRLEAMKDGMAVGMECAAPSSGGLDILQDSLRASVSAGVDFWCAAKKSRIASLFFNEGLLASEADPESSDWFNQFCGYSETSDPVPSLTPTDDSNPPPTDALENVGAVLSNAPDCPSSLSDCSDTSSYVTDSSDCDTDGVRDVLKRWLADLDGTKSAWVELLLKGANLSRAEMKTYYVDFISDPALDAVRRFVADEFELAFNLLPGLRASIPDERKHLDSLSTALVEEIQRLFVPPSAERNSIAAIFSSAKKLSTALHLLSTFEKGIEKHPALQRFFLCNAVEAAVADAETHFEAAHFWIRNLWGQLQALRTVRDTEQRDALRHELAAQNVTQRLEGLPSQCRSLIAALTNVQSGRTELSTANEAFTQLITHAQMIANTGRQTVQDAVAQLQQACEYMTRNVVSTCGVKTCDASNSSAGFYATMKTIRGAQTNAERVVESLCSKLGVNNLTSLESLFSKWKPLVRFVAYVSDYDTSVMARVDAVVNTAATLCRLEDLAADFKSLVLTPLAIASHGLHAIEKARELAALAQSARDAVEEADENTQRLARLERNKTATDADRAKADEAAAARVQCQAKLASEYKRSYLPLLQHFSETREILNEAFPPGDSMSHRGDVSLADFAAIKPAPSTFSDRIQLMTERCTGAQVMLKRFRMDQVSQFRKECDSLRRVKHPFVAELKYTFFNRDDDLHYIVMPYYGGGTLHEWARLNADDGEALLRIFMQVAEGLAVLHANQVTHCDVKPSNVVLTSKLASAMPRIIDFDFARTTDADFLSAATRTVAPGASAGFAAPEIIEFMRTGFSATSQTNLIDALRSPLIDSYAFGRTLACIIDPQQLCADTWVWPQDCSNNRVAIALNAHSTALTELINALLHPQRLQRLTVAAAVAKLRALWYIIHQPRSAKAAEAGQPVTCCICVSDFARRDIIACAPTSNAQHPAHAYCKECFNVSVAAWGDLAPSDHVASKGRLFCVHPVGDSWCGGTLDTAAMLSMLTADNLGTVQRVYGQLREIEALESVKRQLQHSETERAVTYIRETLLGFRCPSCQTPSFIDFARCLSLTCLMCKTEFCGYCLAICADSHAHVSRTHEELGLFTTEATWRAHWEERNRSAIKTYVQSLAPAVQDAVRRQCADLVHLLS